MFNFIIKSAGVISKEFLSRGISDFSLACEYVTQIPYGRNADKTSNQAVFTDGCGTCSTKHALLKNLAMENDQPSVKLILAIFKMSAQNTPAIKNTLAKHKLTYIPEAHNYLLIDGEIVDCTKPGFSVKNFSSDIIQEIEIAAGQITGFKVDYHKQFIQSWLKEKAHLKITPDELWLIREACIEKLSA